MTRRTFLQILSGAMIMCTVPVRGVWRSRRTVKPQVRRLYGRADTGCSAPVFYEDGSGIPEQGFQELNRRLGGYKT